MNDAVEQDLYWTNQSRISNERFELGKLNLPWVKRWQLKNYEFFPIPHGWFVDLYVKHFTDDLDQAHPRIHAIRILSSPAWEITQEIYLELMKAEQKEKESLERYQQAAEIRQKIQNQSIDQDNSATIKTVEYHSPSFWQKLDLFQDSIAKMPESMWSQIPAIMNKRIESFKPVALLSLLPNGKPVINKLSVANQIKVIEHAVIARDYDRASLYIKRFNQANTNLTFTLTLCQVNQKFLLQKNKR